MNHTVTPKVKIVTFCHKHSNTSLVLVAQLWDMCRWRTNTPSSLIRSALICLCSSDGCMSLEWYILHSDIYRSCPGTANKMNKNNKKKSAQKRGGKSRPLEQYIPVSGRVHTQCRRPPVGSHTLSQG